MRPSYQSEKSCCSLPFPSLPTHHLSTQTWPPSPHPYRPSTNHFFGCSTNPGNASCRVLLCLFKACSVKAGALVVFRKVVLQTWHWMSFAASFYKILALLILINQHPSPALSYPILRVPGRTYPSHFRSQTEGIHTTFNCDFATPLPSAAWLRARFDAALAPYSHHISILSWTNGRRIGKRGSVKGHTFPPPILFVVSWWWGFGSCGSGCGWGVFWWCWKKFVVVRRKYFSDFGTGLCVCYCNDETTSLGFLLSN